MIIQPPTRKRADELKNNKDHFWRFIDYLFDEATRGGIKTSTVNQYVSCAINIIERFDKLGINLFDVRKDDINSYIELCAVEVDGTFIATIRRVFRAIKSSHITDKEIDEIERTKKNKRREAPISIEEVIEIRNNLLMKDEYLHLFAFEMFYNYGLTYEEIKLFGENTYSPQERLFTVELGNPGKKVIISDLIVQLLTEHPDLISPRTRYSLSNYRKDICKFTKRTKLILGDIKKTRMDFPTCPRCKMKYPNTDEFWALVQFENDELRTKWLYCKRCVQEMDIAE